MSYVMEVEMMKQIHQMNMPSPIELSRYKEEMDAGKIISGGCCLSPDDATWECSKCHQQIWTPIPEEELIGGNYK